MTTNKTLRVNLHPHYIVSAKVKWFHDFCFTKGKTIPCSCFCEITCFNSLWFIKSKTTPYPYFINSKITQAIASLKVRRLHALAKGVMIYALAWWKVGQFPWSRLIKDKTVSCFCFIKGKTIPCFWHHLLVSDFGATTYCMFEPSCLKNTSNLFEEVKA